MGKKRSKFVQQQKYNQHLQNKSNSNMNNTINKANRKIDGYRKDYEDSVNKILHDFIRDNGLDPDTIPNNSRIIIFELLKKNLQNKQAQYEQYISEHENDENIQEYHDAKKICVNGIEQIDWIYNWTKPLESINLGEGYESYLNDAQEKLTNHEKSFEDLNSVLEVINNTEKSYKDDIRYDFYKFCKFIVKNEIDEYYIYISNTIKNLMILDSDDPIVDFLVKSYNKNADENLKDCENE